MTATKSIGRLLSLLLIAGMARASQPGEVVDTTRPGPHASNVAARALAAGGVLGSWATGIQAWGVAFDTDTRRVWVSSPAPPWLGSSTIYEYLQNGTATGSTHAYTWQPANGPADVAYNRNTGTLWVMNISTTPGTNCIFEIDPVTGFTGNTICPGGTGFFPLQLGLAHDPVNNEYFAGGWNDKSIYRFTPTGTITQQVVVNLDITGLAYNPDTRHLFVMVSANPTALYVLDTASNFAIVGTFAVASGFGGYAGAGLEIDCEGNLWAVDLTTDTVYEIDSGEATTQVCAAGCATAFAVDSNLDLLWSVDAAMGASTVIGSTLPADSPTGLAYDGTTMYSIEGIQPAGQLYTVSLTTGAMTLVASTGIEGWQALASDPTAGGQLYGITRLGELYIIDRTTAATLLVGSGVGGNISALDFDQSGTLWGAEFGAPGTLVTIDKVTGAVTTIGPTTGGFQSIAFCGGILYGTNSDTDSLYTINTATGTATLVGPSVGGLRALEFACPVITLAPAALPNGAAGTGYGQTITASGGTGPYGYAVTAGTLPAGLTLSSAGVLSGTPTTVGTNAFTVTAAQTGGCTGSARYALTVVGIWDYVVGEGLGFSTGNTNRVRVYTRAGTPAAVDFQAYGATRWGTNVSSADINGGTSWEILTGPGPGDVFGPQVRGWSNAGIQIGKVNFYAYGTLKYGVNVASGDLDNDGYAEILSGAGPGTVFGPHVRGWNFDNTTVAPISKISFFAYGTLKYGVNVEEGNVDGDAFTEILTGAGPGQVFGAQVRGFDYDLGNTTSIGKINFFPFTARYGVNVAGGDVDDDGFAEIASTKGPGSTNGSDVIGHDYDNVGITALVNYTRTPFTTLYGGRVGLADITSDGRWDLLCGAGRDSTADSTARSYDYQTGNLTEIVGSGFQPFVTPAYGYGLNVAGGALGI